MIKFAFIKKINENSWRVFSEKGKNMGTFHSLKAAKKRLKDIEFFKRKDEIIKKKNEARKDFYNFILYAKKEHTKEHTKENTYSSYLRDVNKENPKKIKEVMSRFKKIFDEALLKETPLDEIESVCLLELQAGGKNE